MKNVFVALLLLACGTQAPCDATSCATGCCDSNGTCRPGTAASACGKGGATCSSCTTGCTAGVCDGASGGGTAATGGGAAATGGGSSASGGGTSSGTGGGSAASGGGTAQNGGAVVNEIVARGGNEYVELYNPGSTALDLSGYSVTDSHDDGGPDTGKSVRFDTGTMLDSHAFALIMCGRDAGGPSTVCAGGSSCWEATWSISNSRGETVWILDPSNQVVGQTHYPAGGADAGRSYGRLPDGTGNFQETSKTPAAPNAP
jgi:hypothetical protein